MTTGITKGDAYRHLLVARPRPSQPEPDKEKLRLFALAESVSDARRALERARSQNVTRYRKDLAALETMAQELMLQILVEANR